MTAVRRTPRRLALLLVPLVVLAVTAAACGSDDSSDAAGASNTASTVKGAAATVPDSIPPGTDLRVGDQLDALKNVLGTSGQDKDFAYDVKYANFVGGPPMLQAFQADQVDIGYVADTPLIFAQAAKQDVVAVAGWAPERSSFELIVPPGTGLGGHRLVIVTKTGPTPAGFPRDPAVRRRSPW